MNHRKRAVGAGLGEDKRGASPAVDLVHLPAFPIGSHPLLPRPPPRILCAFRWGGSVSASSLSAWVVSWVHRVLVVCEQVQRVRDRQVGLVRPRHNCKTAVTDSLIGQQVLDHREAWALPMQLRLANPPSHPHTHTHHPPLPAGICMSLVW